MPNEIDVPVESPEIVELGLSVDVQDSASAKNAEAWAVGKRGGVDVPATDETYHNHAKYYAQRCEHAEAAALQAEAAAAAAARAQGKAETARTAAEVAQDLAEDAAEDVEAYAQRAEAARDAAEIAAWSIGSGMVFRGSVTYFENLPLDPETGDEYLVLYSGNSGTNYIGQNYVWDGTAWRPIGNDLKLYRDADGDLCEED